MLAVVTAAPGVLLLHRPGETPPAVLPGGRPEPRESPGATAERGCLEETRVRVRAGCPLGRSVVDGIATTYVAARPVTEPAADEVAVGLQVAWYRLEQVDLVLPELWTPVREYLEKALGAYGM